MGKKRQGFPGRVSRFPARSRPCPKKCKSCLLRPPRRPELNTGYCNPCYRKIGLRAVNSKRIRLRNRSDSNKIDIQEKLSSDIVTTTTTPQLPSRLASQCDSNASLQACSTRMEIIPSDERLDHHLKGSDQYQTTRDSEFDIQEKSSSDIVTTAKPRSPSSSDQVQHKRKASEKKKKRAMIKRKAIFTT